MSKKQDYILNYIKKLEPGTKISIRNIADTLAVSEGTAYKAIKRAEELKLVRTRPRAGTIRIKDEAFVQNESLTLKKLIRQFGLSIIAGKEDDTPLSSIIIGDGSTEQLFKEASGASGARLCLVGDRPDIQAAAISLGLHLLVTGGASVNQNIQTTASQNHLCILSSLQSSHHILYLLHGIPNLDKPDTAMNRVSDWMRPPQYLYYNDIVSDWYRTYYSIFALNDRYAVVDENLKICGLLNASSALNAAPTERISNLYTPDKASSRFIVSKDTSMYDLAEKMISENSELAFTVENDELKGLITANDVLRFYHSMGCSENICDFISLEILLDDTRQKKRTLAIRMPGVNAKGKRTVSQDSMAITLKAAEEYVRDTFHPEQCMLTDGTFYKFKNFSFSAPLQLSISLMPRPQNTCTAEVEMNDGNECCLKCILNYNLK